METSFPSQTQFRITSSTYVSIAQRHHSLRLPQKKLIYLIFLFDSSFHDILVFSTINLSIPRRYFCNLSLRLTDLVEIHSHENGGGIALWRPEWCHLRFLPAPRWRLNNRMIYFSLNRIGLFVSSVLISFDSFHLFLSPAQMWSHNI